MTNEYVNMDANEVDSTQVNDFNSSPSKEVKSVSEMDDYNDFMSEEDGLMNASASQVDDYDDDSFNKEMETYGQQADDQTLQNIEEKPQNMELDERGKFFQSKYDTTLRENAQLKQQLEMLQQGVQQTPDEIRQQVIQQLQGNQMPQEQGPVAPEAPSMPIMPKDFDNYEAQTDPSSESAKYIKAQQGYQQNLIQYQQDLVQYNISKSMAEFKQEQQQIAQQEQMQRGQMQQRQQMESNLVSMGMAKEMQSEFAQWLNNDNSIKPIVNMFLRMKNANSNQGNTNGRFTQLQRNNRVPRSAVDVNNASAPMNEQQSFNMSRRNRMLDDY